MANFEFDKIITRVKKILSNPKGIWGEIKAEQTSIKEIYLSYLVFIVAIPAVCHFIGMTIFGLEIPYLGLVKTGSFFGFVNAVFSYILSLVTLLLGAIIIEFLAPKFSGSITRVDALKLLAYSFTASYVAGFLSIVPMMGMIGAFLALFYSLYSYFQGIPVMTGITEKKRPVFSLVSLFSIFLATVLMSFIFNKINPAQTPNNPPTINVNGEKLNLEEMQERIEELQK